MGFFVGLIQQLSVARFYLSIYLSTYDVPCHVSFTLMVPLPHDCKMAAVVPAFTSISHTK